MHSEQIGSVFPQSSDPSSPSRTAPSPPLIPRGAPPPYSAAVAGSSLAAPTLQDVKDAAFTVSSKFENLAQLEQFSHREQDRKTLAFLLPWLRRDLPNLSGRSQYPDSVPEPLVIEALQAASTILAGGVELFMRSLTNRLQELDLSKISQNVEHRLSESPPTFPYEQNVAQHAQDVNWLCRLAKDLDNNDKTFFYDSLHYTNGFNASSLQMQKMWESLITWRMDKIRCSTPPSDLESFGMLISRHVVSDFTKTVGGLRDRITQDRSARVRASARKASKDSKCLMS